MNELKEIREKVRELIYELLKIEETLMKIVDKQTIEEEADKVYFAVPFELKENLSKYVQNTTLNQSGTSVIKCGLFKPKRKQLTR